MESLDFYKILSYGAIGLGCILAFLAYKLLRKEQNWKVPRESILKSINIYMGFSIVLTVVGFVTEFAIENRIVDLKTQINTEHARNLEIAETLSLLLESKELAVLATGGSDEVKRDIDTLKLSVLRLRNINE
ncbi:MAG: hypothetical protein COA96_13120 [SAR86 cluster bacterium]|uniref:Uncharacterized protein n=1 Tax=SAR86 cluster bacterium TaxID=2030880 RepID=A0A2A5AUI2_9GAMM|nr:MAG: hypothetical protein COA96_13120 [SAR86 cluster bacterium]